MFFETNLSSSTFTSSGICKIILLKFFRTKKGLGLNTRYSSSKMSHAYTNTMAIAFTGSD